MKYLIIIASLCCFIGILNFTIGYYTFLRIIISVVALIIIVNEYNNRQRFWFIAFFLVLALFNPIVPVYFHSTWVWIFIDIVVGLLLLIYFLSLLPLKKTKEPEIIDVKHEEIPRTRDRIIK